MNNFEKPPEEESREANPELKAETEKFEDNAEEIAAEIDKTDIEEADEEDIKSLGSKIKATLAGCLAIAGVEAVVASALLDMGNMAAIADIVEKVSKGTMIAGGISIMTLSDRGAIAFEKLFEGWQKVVTLQHKTKESAKN